MYVLILLRVCLLCACKYTLSKAKDLKALWFDGCFSDYQITRRHLAAFISGSLMPFWGYLVAAVRSLYCIYNYICIITVTCKTGFENIFGFACFIVAPLFAAPVSVSSFPSQMPKVEFWSYVYCTKPLLMFM